MAEVEFEFKEGPPEQEEDTPPEVPPQVQFREESSLSREEINERDKDRKDKRYYSAFRLIVGCLIFLAGIYLFEWVSSVFLCSEATETTKSVIEIIKTLLFTLSGYLFGKIEGDNDKK